MAACCSNVPLCALSIEAQTMLSTLLNAVRIIPTENNLPRDWRGIAELAGTSSEKIGLLQTKSDPFKELLTFISEFNNGRRINTEDLKAFLGVIDRFDVLDDITPILDRDGVQFEAKVSEMQLDRNAGVLDPVQDSTLHTYEDVLRAQKGLPLTRYDAFVLYSDESDDDTFATKLVSRLESEHNLKLCSKERDLLPGRFEHEVISRMIESRCNRLLVIFSPSFLESPANQFLVSYAQAVALDTHCRKIIPCVYKKCELPPSVKYSFCIDYNRSSKYCNFWDKLSKSLMVARVTPSTFPLGSSLAVANGQNTDINHASPVLDSVDWWDAEKPTTTLPALQTNTNAINSNNQADEQSDTMSIHSQANLLPSKESRVGSKPTKWFSKIMSPINRKKRSDNEKSKHTAIAE